jgi:hypothetical protein
MKANQFLFAGAAVLTLTLGMASEVRAQATVQQTTTTTQSLGTISEFSPDTIVIRSETAPEPIRYSYTKSTTYVDETGAPVSIETVKSGLPVTVHYTQVGDRMVANRVIVRRATTTTTAPVPTAPVVEKKSTTTTTTTKKDKNDD